MLSAHAEPVRSDHGDIREINDNRPIVLPWSLAIEFPWRSIQGFWKVEQDGFVSYFSLKVIREKTSGDILLRVRQIDGYSCKEIAAGVGYERKSQQAVLAQMTDIDGKSYRIKLTAFRFEDVEKSSLPPVQSRIRMDSVMVMSVKNLETPNLAPVHIQITKVANTLGIKNCIEDVKR